MAPNEQPPAGMVLSRLPPSMQSLRERIGGLKANAESESMKNIPNSVAIQYQQSSEPFQESRDGELLRERGRPGTASTVDARLEGSQSLHRKRSTWESELDEFLNATSSAAAGLDLRSRVHSPEVWLEFLQREEAFRRTDNNVAQSQIGIGRLYEWATKAIPRSSNIGNEDYVRIWIGYAKQQR
jgi:hypothetical protein